MQSILASGAAVGQVTVLLVFVPNKHPHHLSCSLAPEDWICLAFCLNSYRKIEPYRYVFLINQLFSWQFGHWFRNQEFVQEKHGAERRTRIERSENAPVLYYFVFTLFYVFVHQRRSNRSSNPAPFRDEWWSRCCWIRRFKLDAFKVSLTTTKHRRDLKGTNTGSVRHKSSIRTRAFCRRHEGTWREIPKSGKESM